MSKETIKQQLALIKGELVALVGDDSDYRDSLWHDLIDTLELDIDETIESLMNKKGRKSEVLEIMKRGKAIGINEIAKELNISNKNVSSQLSYLRADGYNICTDRNGKKFLIDAE